MRYILISCGVQGIYVLPDRQASNSAPIDEFVLRAMRAWVHALTLSHSLERASALGFVTLGLMVDHAMFGRVMQALDRGSTEDFTVQRTCHSIVPENAAVLLGIRRLTADDRIAQAVTAARALVDPASATALVRGMASVLAAPSPALQMA